MAGLASSKVFAVLAVKNMEESRRFYEDMLGLDVAFEHPGGVTYESGGGQVMVYESDFAGTNEATAAGWRVDDIDAMVEELKSAGVVFEHYDFLPGEWEGDVVTMEGEKAAWFKDPSGNILNIGSDQG